MTRTFEFALSLDPVRRTTKMSTTCIDDKHPLGIANNPYPVFFLEPTIHPEAEISWIADLEGGFGFKQRSGEEKAHGHK